MRPPSYYTSLANSNSSNRNPSSSQQLRSSFSSNSSTSYATRTHLPFAPQTMLVAHCYTGVGSTTKPYGQSSNSVYSPSRLSVHSNGSYTSSYSRPISTKRHLPSSISSNPSASSTLTSSSPYSHYTPRSSYRPTGYSRPSAYSYQPIKLRERPLLTRISNQINSNRLATTTTTTTTGAGRTSQPGERNESLSRLESSSSGGKQSSPLSERETQEAAKKEEENWSSDVARNISRNKYLIKFREFDKRSSIVPDRDLSATAAAVASSNHETPSLDKTTTTTVGVDLDSRFEEAPPKGELQKLAVAANADEKKGKKKATREMRLPIAISDDQKQVANSEPVGIAPLETVNSVTLPDNNNNNKFECDKDDSTATTKKALINKPDSEQPKKAPKVPKERRNIKLKIKNLNNNNQLVSELLDQAESGGVSVPPPPPTTKTQETSIESQKPATPTPTAPTTTPTKMTKVKRLIKGSSKSAVDESGESIEKKKTEQTKSELKAKDSLLTKKAHAEKKSSPNRRVLSPKQLNNDDDGKTSAAAAPDRQQTTTATKSSSNNSLSSPQSADSTTASKRIRFREYNYDDFNFLSVLGHGGWGFVILAELKNHDACFAVKCIKKITIVEDDDFDSIMIERKVLSLGDIHPFICKLFCTFETEGYLFFAMEYCAGGDLMFHVQREGKFTEARSRFYAAEIICAIKFLHNRHIIYRDLKLDNILLDSRGHIRLVDFGMCQCRTYREEMLPSNFCGTPEYISPEIIKGVPYNHSVDWWSFGVLLYEMAVGKMPFRGSDENELLWNVCYEQIHYPMFLTKELTSLLQSLLEREPTKRMGMSTCKAGDIYDQPWFKGVDWKAIEELRVQPPFVPEVTSKRDVQNFDSDFTQSTPELSPVDETTLKKIDQNQFQKFPYTNPNIFIFS